MEDISSLLEKRKAIQDYNKGFRAAVARSVLYLAVAVKSALSVLGCVDPINPGFGENETDATDYVESKLDSYSYSSQRNVNAQFLNPDITQEFSNNYDIYAEGPSGEEIYVEYVSEQDGLTQEQRDGIEARTGAGMPPPLVVIEPDDSMDTIDAKIDEAVNGF
jgi:hypothetical protein